MRCRRPANTRRDTALLSSRARRNCSALTTPCCLAAILAITRSPLARLSRIARLRRQLRALAPNGEPGASSLPVFRAHEAEVRPPYDQRAMAASAQYSVTVRVELDARQEPLGKLTAQIAEAGG